MNSLPICSNGVRFSNLFHRSRSQRFHCCACTADGKAVKTEWDKQIEAFLGPRTEEDKKKPSKKSELDLLQITPAHCRFNCSVADIRAGSLAATACSSKASLTCNRARRADAADAKKGAAESPAA